MRVLVVEDEPKTAGRVEAHNLPDDGAALVLTLPAASARAAVR